MIRTIVIIPPSLRRGAMGTRSCVGPTTMVGGGGGGSSIEPQSPRPGSSRRHCIVWPRTKECRRHRRIPPRRPLRCRRSHAGTPCDRRWHGGRDRHRRTAHCPRRCRHRRPDLPNRSSARSAAHRAAARLDTTLASLTVALSTMASS